MSLKAIVAMLTMTAAIPVFSQVVPAATSGGTQFKVGAGFSDYEGGLNNGRLTGGALWVDINSTKLPPLLHGWGLEAEARGVQVDQTSPAELGTFRQATAGGGPMYTYLRFPRFHPYAKFVVNYAGQSFRIGSREYFETQVAYAPGGGLEYQVFSRLWARADYEYQIWPNPFNNPNWYLDPEGITVGLAWELKPLHRH
jgi:opacity protein-like surface antigen